MRLPKCAMRKITALRSWTTMEERLKPMTESSHPTATPILWPSSRTGFRRCNSRASLAINLNRSFLDWQIGRNIL